MMNYSIALLLVKLGAGEAPSRLRRARGRREVWLSQERGWREELVAVLKEMAPIAG